MLIVVVVVVVVVVCDAATNCTCICALLITNPFSCMHWYTRGADPWALARVLRHQRRAPGRDFRRRAQASRGQRPVPTTRDREGVLLMQLLMLRFRLLWRVF
jgi:hypothetical protein